MLAIRRLLNSYIQVGGDLTDINDSNKENSAVEAPPPEHDPTVVSSLLEMVVILWRSVEKALKQNEEADKYTTAKFGSVMAKYFQVFQDERSTAPLLQMASLMPPAAVPTFSCGVLSRLRRMDPRAASAQYCHLLDCICSWGQTADVLELVTDWLSEALPKQGKKAAKGRRVQILETVEAKPDLALVYLEYLFSHTSAQEKVLALCQGPLKQLHTVLGKWKLVLYTHLSATTEDPELPRVETALNAFTYHVRLSAHLQHNLTEGRDYLLSVEDVAGWVADRVLPFLRRLNENDAEKSQQLAARITESFLSVCRDILLVGLADDAFKGQVLHLCSLILLSELGYMCIPAVLPILKEVVNSCVPIDISQDQENPEESSAVLLGVVANIFQKIIELLARRLKKEPEEGKQLCQSAAPGLTDFLQVAQTWGKAPLSGVFSTVFAAIVVEKRHLLQKITHPEEVIVPQSVDDMPLLSSILLSVVLKSPSVTGAFLSEVVSSLDSEAISSLTELAAVLHVLAVVKHSGRSKGDWKRAAVSVQQQIHSHAVSSVDGSDIQRVIYASSVTTLNEILEL